MIKDQTWIASASPEKLVVRHRSGRLISFLSFFFGSVFLVVAINESSGMRWAAGGLALLNYVLAAMRSALVTITFDRPAGEVECREQRLISNKSATLPLAEFAGAEIRQAAGGRPRSRLGLSTRTGAFIPIEHSFTSGARTEIARVIDQWLGEPDAPEESPSGEQNA